MPNDLVRQLRDMVARSLDLALSARQNGHEDLSQELIMRAIQCAERAGVLEAMRVSAKEE